MATRSGRWTRMLGAAALAGALGQPPAWAQVTTADLLGTVTDSSGGLVLGATAVAENLGTGEIRATQTDLSGNYLFSLLPIGRYSLRIELPAFKTFVVEELVLAGGDRVRVNARMEFGLQEVMEVVSAPVPLQTDSSALSSLVTERAVQDLPLNGRNYIRLVQLFTPGANESVPNALSSGNRPDDRRLTSAVSVSGQADIVNNHMIDGMDNNERAIGTIGVRPSVDAIAEVRVHTNVYTAEVGRTAGGVINIITKSGTNGFHGSAYEFFRHEALDARNYFAPRGEPKPRLRQHQFGGSLGGPVRRDRTFFFVDYERFDSTQGVTYTTTVPTLRMRNGDFSELLAGPNPVIVYDPTTFPRAPFPANVIPSERMDPVARQYLALYPLPTGDGLFNNFTASPNRTQVTDTFDVRLDHRFGDDTTAFVRYSFNDVQTFTPNVFPEVDGVSPGGSLGVFAGPAKARAHGVQLSAVHVFGPRRLLEARFGYLHNSIESLPPNYGLDVSERFGLHGANFDEATSGLTPMVIAGYASLGDEFFLPLEQSDDTFQANLALTEVRGAHSLKVGIGVVRRHFTVFQSAFPTGFYVFNGSLTNDGAGVGGDSVASFMLGYPFLVQRSNSLVRPRYRTWEPSIYVQDDWRAARWLTVNLGLRYDIFTPFTEADDQISNLDLETGKMLVAGRDGVSRTAGISTDYSNVAPRLGFAATLGKGFVLRGGYGLSYFPGNYTSFSHLKNAPFLGGYGPAVSFGAFGGPPTLSLSQGLPLPTAVDVNDPTGTINAVAQDFRSTRAQQFNVTLEKELGANVFSVGYVSMIGTHEAQLIPNLNLAPPGPGDVQARRPYAQRLPKVGTIALLTSSGRSRYRALQTSFLRRHRNGLTVSANYTWGHAQNDVQNPGSGGGGYGVLPGEIGRVDWGNADLDVRHRAILAANYELPFGRSSTGLARQLLAGWQINVLGFWQSGLPFSVVNAGSRSNTGAQADRPHRIGDGRVPDPGPEQWFDTSDFVPQPLFTVGDSGRNILYGPPQRRIDLSVFKSFWLGGDRRLQFRAECFNLTNTVNFGQPNAALGSRGFGTITAAGPPRQIQLAVKLLF